VANSLRLVVVPSDSIADYEKAGLDWLARYYNPEGMFDEVFVVSPLESGRRDAHGMVIIGASEHEFTHIVRSIAPAVLRAYGGMSSGDLVCRRRPPETPTIVSLHDSHPRCVAASVTHADMVLCTSEAVRRTAARIGVARHRIRVLPNRVDTAKFTRLEPGPQWRRLDERFGPGKRVLHVGRKSAAKNIETVLGALGELGDDYIGIFVGRGETGPYRELAQRLGVARRCHWVESVPNSELPLWYSWCDCLCVPSRWEGFGIVFIEAAACGTPIVTSRIAPMNEYLRHNVSAFLVEDYLNARAMAAGVKAVCEDKALAQRLGSGAVLAARPFAAEVVDALEADYYREAIAQGAMSMRRRLQLATWRTRAQASGWLWSRLRPKRRGGQNAQGNGIVREGGRGDAAALPVASGDST
jgi:glycosyltransferase involved in cell wall biosynthesis